jgi:aquaporin rerated protein, other eukaryote
MSTQVTLGLVITGNLPWLRGLLLLPAQMLGGIVAAALVRCMFPGPLAVNTNLGNGTTPAQGVFIEMFLTSLLVFTILMLAAEKHYATFMAPVGIGLALFVAMMAGLPFTGASLNPARSFGPAVASANFPGYHYIYWFGPIVSHLTSALHL